MAVVVQDVGCVIKLVIMKQRPAVITKYWRDGMPLAISIEKETILMLVGGVKVGGQPVFNFSIGHR